jgi:tryptophanase
MVQRINLLPIRERFKAITGAGYNTFSPANREVFLDMLTDSRVNPMSEMQFAAMMMADDSYARSETFFRLSAVLDNIFGTEHFLPAHQGRARENIITNTFVRPGGFTITNYCFTTWAYR